MIIELIALGLVLAMGWLLWSGYFLYNALANGRLSIGGLCPLKIGCVESV